MKSLAVAVFTVSAALAQEPFVVYSDKGAVQNHYVPSGWMGDTGDLKIDEGYTKDPKDGDTCIKITYSAERKQGSGWAGIIWQNPANNWGANSGGHNLNGYSRLTFWAKGDEGNGYEPRIEEFKMGGILGVYSDSASTSIGPIELKDQWTQYEIPLKGMDLSQIIGGFGFSASADYNGAGFTIYLDEIKYE